MKAEIQRIVKAVELALCTVIYPPISSGATEFLLANGYRLQPDSTVFIGGVKISRPEIS
jgi:hypothetical protein